MTTTKGQADPRKFTPGQIAEAEHYVRLEPKLARVPTTLIARVIAMVRQEDRKSKLRLVSSDWRPLSSDAGVGPRRLRLRPSAGLSAGRS